MELEKKYSFDDISEYFRENESKKPIFKKIYRIIYKLRGNISPKLKNILIKNFEEYKNIEDNISNFDKKEFLEVYGKKNDILDLIFLKLNSHLGNFNIKLDLDERKKRVGEILNSSGEYNKYGIVFKKLFGWKLATQFSIEEQKVLFKLFNEEFRKNKNVKLGFFGSASKIKRRESSDIDFVILDENYIDSVNNKVKIGGVKIDKLYVSNFDKGPKNVSNLLDYKTFDEVRKEVFLREKISS